MFDILGSFYYVTPILYENILKHSRVVREIGFAVFLFLFFSFYEYDTEKRHGTGAGLHFT